MVRSSELRSNKWPRCSSGMPPNTVSTSIANVRPSSRYTENIYVQLKGEHILDIHFSLIDLNIACFQKSVFLVDSGNVLKMREK